MGGEQRFFEIAVGLIPVLLFGGVLVERLSPTAGIQAPAGTRRLLGWMVILSAPLAIAAEGYAIQGAISGDSTAFGRALVTVTVFVGTCGVALAIALPWMAKLGLRAAQGWIIGICTVLLVVPLYRAVDSAISTADFRQDLEEYDRVSRTVEARFRRVSDLEARRTQLLLRLEGAKTKGARFVIDQELKRVNGDIESERQHLRSDTKRLEDLILGK